MGCCIIKNTKVNQVLIGATLPVLPPVCGRRVFALKRCEPFPVVVRAEQTTSSPVFVSWGDSAMRAPKSDFQQQLLRLR